MSEKSYQDDYISGVTTTFGDQVHPDKDERTLRNEWPSAQMLPVEYKILVKPDAVDEVTPGRLHIPDQIREKERREQVFGTLIAVGGLAFSDWKPPIPVPGDRVLVAKYAGISQKGADGEWYQIMYDKDIACIVRPSLKKDLSESDLPDYEKDGKYSHLRSA